MTGRKRCALLATAAALLLVFAPMALAKPDWVTVKYTGCKIVTTKNTKVTDGNHRRLVLYFDVINNSKSGEIITAVYDRKISYKGVFTINQMEWGTIYGPVETQGWKPVSWNISYSGRFTNPEKGEWYPGQVYKYDITIPLSTLIKPYGDWKKTNEAVMRSFSFKPTWSFDFSVQSHK